MHNRKCPKQKRPQLDIFEKNHLTNKKHSIKIVWSRTKRGVDMNKNEIGKYIQIVSRQIKRNMDETLNCYNVTGVQSMLIGYIYRKSKKGDVYAKDIEEEFNMRKATVTGIIQLMETNGLIERRAKEEDCRLKKIVLTNKAMEIEKKVQKQINVMERNIVCDMEKDEKEQFLKLLKKASYNLYKVDAKKKTINKKVVKSCCK